MFFGWLESDSGISIFEGLLDFGARYFVWRREMKLSGNLFRISKTSEIEVPISSMIESFSLKKASIIVNENELNICLMRS